MNKQDHSVVHDPLRPRAGESASTALFAREVPMGAILGALTLLYIAVIWVPITRHLWYDELLTYRIAQIPTVRQMLAMAPRWDLNPPLLHLLSHASLRLGSGNPIAIRAPSVLEYYFAGVFLFLYSARKLGHAWAALPVLFLWYGPIAGYATEARPYALLCFWFCALLLLWDIAIAHERRALLLAAIAFSSVGLLASHVFGLLIFAAFFSAEAVRAWQRRKPDWPLWGALFGPLVLTVLYVPLFRSYRAITAYPAAFQASPHTLAAFYWHNFTGIALCAAVALAAALAAGKKAKSAAPSDRRSWLSLSENVLFGLQIVMPLLLGALLMLQHGAFWGRYCITTIVALYFVTALLVKVLSHEGARAGYAAITAAGALTLVHGLLWPLWKQETAPVPASAAVLERIKPQLPLVAASGLTFVEMGEYESPALLRRLFYLQDQAAAMHFANATMFDDLEDFHRTFHLPGRVEPYTQFVNQHPDFLVLATPGYPEDWLLRKLAADGAAIARLGVYATPYKDKQLFEVHLTGRK